MVDPSNDACPACPIKGYRGLSRKEAQDIYQEKIKLLKMFPVSDDLDNKVREELALGGKSLAVAERFKTSPKTVRDIWSHR